MSYFDTWNQRIEDNNQESLNEYAKDYYSLEANAYRKILSAYPDTEWKGTAAELAEKLEFDGKMDIFVGFLDGINTSLKQSIDLASVEDNTEIHLDIDYEKLYWNMHEASAKWLYDLEEWDHVLSREKRVMMTKDFNREHIAVSNKVGRNDPCTCGSGKKYKNCCGKRN